MLRYIKLLLRQYIVKCIIICLAVLKISITISSIVSITWFSARKLSLEISDYRLAFKRLVLTHIVFIFKYFA